jgi:hypothetical protein
VYEWAGAGGDYRCQVVSCGGRGERGGDAIFFVVAFCSGGIRKSNKPFVYLKVIEPRSTKILLIKVMQVVWNLSEKAFPERRKQEINIKNTDSVLQVICAK